MGWVVALCSSTTAKTVLVPEAHGERGEAILSRDEYLVYRLW